MAGFVYCCPQRSQRVSEKTCLTAALTGPHPEGGKGRTARPHCPPSRGRLPRKQRLVFQLFLFLVLFFVGGT